MNTTVPVPIESNPELRSDLGLFAAKDVDTVVDNLRQDLLARGTTPETLLEAYTAAVSSPERREEAEQTIAQFLNRELDGSALRRLVEVMYFAGYQRYLAKHHIRFPSYNILDEYFVNATAPWGPVVLPRPEVSTRHWTLFGQRIGLPIGVPASVLTGNARWIQYYSSNGFNVLTYKTVRSRRWRPNEPPNWAFVPNEKKPFAVTDEQYTVHADPLDWVDPGERDVTTTNSFGVPCPDPVEWKADLYNALKVIASDQVLIVSVMGEDYDESPARLTVLADDYAKTALHAEAAGASIIELNLSCPNSLDPTESRVKLPLCFDVDATARILEEVKSRLSSQTRLVAKLAYLDEARLNGLIHRIAPMIDGVAGINTLQCTVLRDSDDPTFPGRGVPWAGVSGIAIRDYAKDFVFRLARLRVETGKYFEILGMGGVTDPASFEALYLLGASAVQSATGAFANPFLASECVESLGNSLPLVPPILDDELASTLKTTIVAIAAECPAITKYEIASSLPLRPPQTFDLLEDLVRSGELVDNYNKDGRSGYALATSVN